MKNKIMAVAGATALALTMSASASHAGYMEPGETMGVSLLSPLPEGVFFADLEDYGRSQLTGPAAGGGASPHVGLGVNIPVVIWSTPFSFYNTRLEFIVALPFAHLDGAGLDRIGAITFAAGPLLAHDFGNGLTGGIGALFRGPDPSSNIQGLSGRTEAAFDLRQSLQYSIKTGAFSGITLIENAAFTSVFASNYGPTVLTSDGSALGTVGPQNNLFAGDFTIEKTIGKLTVGFTGFGNIDTDQRKAIALQDPLNPREANVAVGGLVAYDFGKFSLTGIVTTSVLDHPVVPTVSQGHETRGWLRLIVPLYVAPTAPVVARY